MYAKVLKTNSKQMNKANELFFRGLISSLKESCSEFDADEIDVCLTPKQINCNFKVQITTLSFHMKVN